jgi:peptidoglycan/LPS O-acetylase OafA/YrhL
MLSSQAMLLLGFLNVLVKISFSLYLLHQPIISIANKIIIYTGLIAGFPVYIHFCVLALSSILISFPISLLFYNKVELISVSFGKKIWDFYFTRQITTKSVDL